MDAVAGTLRRVVSRGAEDHHAAFDTFEDAVVDLAVDRHPLSAGRRTHADRHRPKRRVVGVLERKAGDAEVARSLVVPNPLLIWNSM